MKLLHPLLRIGYSVSSRALVGTESEPIGLGDTEPSSWGSLQDVC